MMLKSLLLVIALTGAAHAAEPGFHFQALDDLFKVSTQPNVAELRGWMSGRCFFAGARDKARPSLLAVEAVSSDADMMIAMLGDESDSAYLYDSPSNKLKSELRRAIANEISSSVYSTTSYYGGSLVESVSDRYTFEARQAEQLVVFRVVLLHESVVAYCYYSKKVDPSPSRRGD